MRNRVLPCCALVVALALVGGCSSGPSEEELKLAQLQEQVNVLRQTADSLGASRAELKQTNATLAEVEAIAERDRSDEQKLQLEELTAKLPELEQAINTTYDSFQTMLADFLNLALNDFPNATETVEGLQMYSMESISNADDIVRKSGDYKKANELLITTKNYYEIIDQEPYQGLVDKMAELDELRYITEERFDLVKKGMTKDEVIATIGQVYYRNIQDDAERKVTTWLYPKREGGAAAVYFRMKNEKAYGKKFDAIKPKVVNE